MRRTAGSGSVDRLPSGRWRARVRLDTGAQVSLGTSATEAEARALLDAGVRELAARQAAPTVAHVDHDESNNDPGNLLALCQRCHLKLDAADNLARKRERKAAEAGQKPLPLLAVMPENRKAVSHVG